VDSDATATASDPDAGAAALTRALERVGWPASAPASAYEVASFAWHILDACVHGHQDVALCQRDLADLMRSAARRPDAALPSVETFMGRAGDLPREYVRATDCDRPA
jgi:hypothetical protein